MLQSLHVLLTFGKLQNPLCLPRETACELSKVVGACGVSNMLTSKCASRHSVHFFDMSTSKSAVSFLHFWLEMCFAPQRRALFRHLNFQKCSVPGVFCAFWLRNVLRATTACTFSTSQLPKVLHIVHFDFEMCFTPQRRPLFRHLNFKTCSELYILTWTCALCHNGVQFFISYLATWLCTRRFSEPTFRPSWATSHRKDSVSWLSYLFAHLDLLSFEIFFLLLFSSLTLPISAFHLSILLEFWLLNFLR